MNIMNRFTLFITSIIVLSGCRDPYHGDLGSPSDKIEAISGSWILENVMQIDEKAPDKKQIDLSNFYQNFIFTFDKDSMTFHLDTINLISCNATNFFIVRGDEVWTSTVHPRISYISHTPSPSS